MNRSILWLLVASMLFFGCSRYPEVSTVESQRFIQQLYTACNTQDPERLKACQRRLEEMVESGQVGSQEQQEFERIINQAQAGRWEQSQSDSLDFARRQVRD